MAWLRRLTWRGQACWCVVLAHGVSHLDMCALDSAWLHEPGAMPAARAHACAAQQHAPKRHPPIIHPSTTASTLHPGPHWPSCLLKGTLRGIFYCKLQRHKTNCAAYHTASDVEALKRPPSTLHLHTHSYNWSLPPVAPAPDGSKTLDKTNFSIQSLDRGMPNPRPRPSQGPTPNPQPAHSLGVYSSTTTLSYAEMGLEKLVYLANGLAWLTVRVPCGGGFGLSVC